MGFKKATKAQSKLRLALCGLAGSGKTYSMLSIASAMGAEMRRLGHGDGRIGLLDTEHRSAELYADKFDFDVMPMDNHSPRTYVDGIKEAESAGYDFVIIDSLSHAWSGKNGALEQKDNAAARGGNSWTAWRDITPMHNLLIDTMLSCRMHLLASMRTKMEYVQTSENGKTRIEKVGLAAIQREGMEYEFTVVGDIGLDHVLKISKSRLDGVLSLGDAFEKPGEAFAKKVYGWLMTGVAPVKRVDEVPALASQPEPSVVDEIAAVSNLAELDALIPKLKTLTGRTLEVAREAYGRKKLQLSRPTPPPASGDSSLAEASTPDSSETQSTESTV
jgi:hypothetical protein